MPTNDKRNRNAERQAKFRAAHAQHGMRQLTMMVPVSAMPELKRACELIRAEPTLSVRLWDTRTGRVRALR